MTTATVGDGPSDGRRDGSDRSRRKKVSKYITKQQAQNLLDALAFADEIGFRLNVSIDINWLLFGGTTDDKTRIARFQERLSKWCSRQGFPLTLIWVREIGRYGDPNAHILMHVPPWLMEGEDFQAVLERALEPEGGPNHDKAIFIQPADRPRGKLVYMLKGLRPDEAEQFGVRTSFQGSIQGKRCGCTENIGRSARRRGSASSAARRTTTTKEGTGSHTQIVASQYISLNNQGIESAPRTVP